MELYLMQHGASLSAELDPDRPLSPMGLDSVRKTARATRLMGIEIDLVLSSPKTRAVQTASLMAQGLRLPESRILQTESLNPKTPPEQTLEALRAQSHQESLLLVGHLPNLARLVGLLATAQAGQLSLNIENTGLARLDIQDLEPGQGRLMWYLAPLHLQIIAGAGS